ncbi:unnamed protein product [Sphagnum tenellum]
MDALCDPRAFLSAQDKRAEQLKALGIEETDISKDVIESKGRGGQTVTAAADGQKPEGDDVTMQLQSNSQFANFTYLS